MTWILLYEDENGERDYKMSWGDNLVNLQREIIKLIVEKGPLTKEEIITEIQKRFNK